MLSGVSTVCFLSSYAVALALEASRLFLRIPVRIALMVLFAAAGVFAHSVYLWLRLREQLPEGVPLSSWHDWCLIVAWVLAATYLMLVVWHPRTALGLFILPLVMLLVGAGELVRNAPPFPREQAVTIWGLIHGAALLWGTVVVMLGFVAGLMYLVQSYRLKRKLPPRQGLRLPSLERLQKENELALVLSSLLLAVGLLSGIVLNLVRSSVVAWTDPVVWTSGILLLWLVAALIFNAVYKPARRGRKVAYLVVASFVFLALVLGVVLLVHHGSPAQARLGGMLPQVARGGQP